MKKVLSIIIVLSLFLTTGMPLLASETENTFGLTDSPSENIEETEENEETQPLETQNTTETQEETVSTEGESLPESSSEPQEETVTTEEPTTSEETSTESTTAEETTTTEETTELIEETIETYPIETEPGETETVEETKPSETEPVAKKGPVLRAPVRATINYLTYENGKYMYIDDMSDPDAVPTAHDDFPYTGRFALGGNVPIYAKVNIDELYIDTNGYDLIDRCTFNVNTNSNGGVISVQQGDILEISGTGRFVSEQLGHHAAVYMNNGGTFNLIDATIEHFLTDGNGAGVSINHKNDVFTMSGNACIKDCTTTASSGGGGVNVLQGKFYMLDNSSVTDCHNIFSNGGEKLGNGAGVQVGTNGTLYMRDYSSITNCSGTGYHGAGVDLWSKGNMYMSGSPTITGNMNGKNYPVNLNIGSIVHIDGELNIAPHAVGISIQSSPVFTTGLKANNPNKTIYELLEMFDADRYYWDDLPRHEEYHIIDQNLTEAKQAPVIVVHFMYNYDNMGEWKSQEVVPGGYATSPGNPTRNGYNFNGWFRTTATTGSAWNFGSNTVPVNEDLNLYAKWQIKTYTVTVTVTGETGHVTTSANATVNHGSSYTFTATTENATYKIVSYKINNVEQLTENQTSITDVLSNITANKTITIVVEKQQIRTNVTVVENGNESGITVSPTHEQIVNPGEDVSYQFTLQDGYYVEEIFINFVCQPYTDTLLFEDIDEDKDIVITVNKMPQITFNYDGYVSQLDSSLQTQFVMPNTDLTGTISTLDGYHISELIIDGTPQSLYVECDIYDISLLDITEDHVVSVKIAKNETVPAPTGVVLTVAPFVAVVVILGVCVVLVKRKRK